MGARFTKSEVTMHAEMYRTANPAVNVKVYSMGASIQDVVERFGCTEEQAEHAMEFASECACEQFWEYWQDTKGDFENGISGSKEYAYFPGHDVSIDCEGRSGGWLIVNGLPEVCEWDAILVSRWNKFQKAVKDDVAYRMGKDVLLEDIAANEWHKPHSSKYNFCDTDKGTLCLADMRADVIAYAQDKFGVVPTID